jgi:hypothetical protein
VILGFPREFVQAPVVDTRAKVSGVRLDMKGRLAGREFAESAAKRFVNH